MYQKTLIIIDWTVVFSTYLLLLLMTPVSGRLLKYLDENTANAFLNAAINTIIGLIFISFLAFLIKSVKARRAAPYAWLIFFFIITVSFLSKVEITRQRLHFLGYGIMSLFLYRALRHKVGTKMLYAWTSGIIITFAILDETVQSVVGSGRSFELKDVGIDWLSGLLAQLLIVLVARPKLRGVDIKIRQNMDRLKRCP